MLNLKSGWLLGALLLTACSHQAKAPRQAPPPPSAAPALSLDVNSQTDATVYRGWPLLIRTAVFSASGDRVEVGVQTGAWTEALRLTVTDQAGALQTWPLQRVPPASQTLSLTGSDGAEAVWLVAPEVTQSIAAGTYSLAAALDTSSTAASGTWSGSTTSSGAGVTLGDEPTTLSAEDVAAKYLALAAYARLKGDTQGVGSALDTLMSLQPDMLEAYLEKGDLLSSGGDSAGALALYKEALAKFEAAYPNAPEPLTLFERRIDGASAKLAAGQGGR